MQSLLRCQQVSQASTSTQRGPAEGIAIANAHRSRVSWSCETVSVIYRGQSITGVRETEQKKDCFMAMVSHDAKTPMHEIVGLCGSL